jgi:hypothetical protein
LTTQILRLDLLTANSWSQAVPLDRLEVGATRYGADVIAGKRKLDREVTTDGSGTVHTNLHAIFLPDQSGLYVQIRSDCRYHAQGEKSTVNFIFQGMNFK